MRVLWLPAALALVTATACAGGSGQATLHPGSPGHTITATDGDNHSTIRAHVGDTLVVTLHNTYWRFATPSSTVVSATDAAAPTAGSPSCPSIPGTGCGTVTMTYRVMRPGSAVLSANRTSCGEALRCTGGQGDWQVNVVASP